MSFATLLCTLILLQPAQTEPAPPDMFEKVAAYRHQASQFDLVFVGDSRTYCAMHPERLDPLLGTRSVNLGYWAHWLPCQYAAIRDILEVTPPGTTIVWSIGVENFHPVNELVDTSYPIVDSIIGRYLTWGFPMQDLQRNVKHFGSLAKRRDRLSLRPNELNVTQILSLPDRFRDRVDGWMGRKLWSNVPMHLQLRITSTTGEEAKRMALQEIIDDSLRDRSVIHGHTHAVTDGDRLTSVALLYKGGGYERVEIDHAFFREKQRQFAEDLLRRIEKEPVALDPHPAYWNTFNGILDLFASHRAKLIVNEMAKAPKTYLGDRRKAESDEFMVRRVRPAVEARGFIYLRVNWEAFTDEDYFDYNHLNRRGILKFSKMFSEALGPQIGGHRK